MDWEGEDWERTGERGESIEKVLARSALIDIREEAEQAITLGFSEERVRDLLWQGYNFLSIYRKAAIEKGLDRLLELYVRRYCYVRD